MTPDSSALEQALASVEVRPGLARRVDLPAGGLLSLPTGESALVYLRGGELTGDAGSGCTLDAPSGDAAASTGRRTLIGGDAVLTLGCRDLTLSSESGAAVTVVPMELASAAVTHALPSVVFVSGFARAEPAAAALAGHLGTSDVRAGAPRTGDQTICRMMVTTVLLSALRAWASDDRHAPWPPRIDDPFLSRVTAAVADEPGREWTIDQLAALGAMSRSVFAERFRRAFGRSPATYVAEVRMQRAKRLLEEGAGVSETSRALGYASDEGFSRAFRRHTGVAPSRWNAARLAS